MDYEKRYNELIDAIKEMMEANPHDEGLQNWVQDNVSELAESEDEKIRKELRMAVTMAYNYSYFDAKTMDDCIAWLEKQGEPVDKGEISDGFHTFNELYYYRMLYNAAFFNMLPKELVHKSKKHNDGEECFGGGWFIVMANLPTGQISNHYELKDWDLFQIPEKEIADKWDGHTPQEAAERLHNFLLEKQEPIDRDKLAKGVLRGVANSIIQWLDANVAEGNMCLSNMECEDLENAVINSDWSKVYDYMKKKLEKQGEQNYKIIKGKNYFCVKTHNYAGVEWIKGTKYYASDNYTLVNQGCEYYCQEYSKEEHNNLFEEVKYDGCVENKIGQKFKVGDIVQYITDSTDRRKIEEIDTLCNMYHTDSSPIMFEIEDEWKVVVNAEDVEQKPTDNVEPKFHIGDWVVNKSGFAQQVLDFRCGIYTCTYSSFTTDCESNYHLWTIKDAKPGDVIAWDDSKCIAIFKSIYDEDSFNSYGFVGHCTGTFETFESRQSYHEIEGAHPATKEQYDTLMQAIAKAGYEFDFEKKELLKIEK